MTARLVPLAAALVFAAALAGCGGNAAEPVAQAGSSRFAGSELTPPSHPPGFRLRDQDGKTVSLAAQRGRLVLVTFLYVHCPDVCPLIASSLNTALRRLPAAERRHVRVLAVSVDPRGDTPLAVRGFIREHRLLPEFRYLTGTEAQLRPVWRGYHVGAQGSGGEISHTAYTLLVDGNGRGRVMYDAQATPAAVVHDLRLLERT